MSLCIKYYLNTHNKMLLFYFQVGVPVCVIQMSRFILTFFLHLNINYVLTQLFLDTSLYWYILKITPINLHLIKNKNGHTVNTSLMNPEILYPSIYLPTYINKAKNQLLIFHWQFSGLIPM